MIDNTANSILIGRPESLSKSGKKEPKIVAKKMGRATNIDIIDIEHRSTAQKKPVITPNAI